MSTAPSTGTTIQALLAAADLEITPAEFDTLVAVYPDMRSDVDALYAVPMAKEEEPQLIFTPLV